jgi:hypothetical protein
VTRSARSGGLWHPCLSRSRFLPGPVERRCCPRLGRAHAQQNSPEQCDQAVDQARVHDGPSLGNVCPGPRAWADACAVHQRIASLQQARGVVPGVLPRSARTSRREAVVCSDRERPAIHSTRSWTDPGAKPNRPSASALNALPKQVYGCDQIQLGVGPRASGGTSRSGPSWIYLGTAVSGLLSQGGEIAGGLPVRRPDLHGVYNLVEIAPARPGRPESSRVVGQDATGSGWLVPCVWQ